VQNARVVCCSTMLTMLIVRTRLCSTLLGLEPEHLAASECSPAALAQAVLQQHPPKHTAGCTADMLA
jgi:hypothetical protein